MPHLESSADTAYYNQLPTVSFRVITDDPSLSAPAGVHSVSQLGPDVCHRITFQADYVGADSTLWL